MEQKKHSPVLTRFQKFFLVLLSSWLVNKSQAQRGWEVGIGAGLSLPLTGYKAVLSDGWLLGAQGKYRFGNGNVAVGMKTSFVRMQKDRNPSDAFQNARMTLAPVLFFAEYEMKTGGAIQPYVGGGLGLSLYSLNYDVNATQGRSLFNVSFTMAPQLGLRYKASDCFFPFVEGNLVLLADGPPQGFPKGERMTGYGGVEGGIAYRFH